MADPVWYEIRRLPGEVGENPPEVTAILVDEEELSALLFHYTKKGPPESAMGARNLANRVATLLGREDLGP